MGEKELTAQPTREERLTGARTRGQHAEEVEQFRGWAEALKRRRGRLDLRAEPRRARGRLRNC